MIQTAHEPSAERIILIVSLLAALIKKKDRGGSGGTERTCHAAHTHPHSPTRCEDQNLTAPEMCVCVCVCVCV